MGNFPHRPGGVSWTIIFAELGKKVSGVTPTLYINDGQVISMKARAHVFITGIVQGVLFRESARKEAISRGVAGWIRNLDDGQVEAVFEGEKDRVNEVVMWCYTGPSYAKVQNVKLDWEDYTGEFTSFVIVR
jgi:acylphosphatase